MSFFSVLQMLQMLQKASPRRLRRSEMWRVKSEESQIIYYLTILYNLLFDNLLFTIYLQFSNLTIYFPFLPLEGEVLPFRGGFRRGSSIFNFQFSTFNFPTPLKPL